MYRVEVIWNREHNYAPYGLPYSNEELEHAVRLAEAVRDSGDGARVKSARVVDNEGKVHWQDGKYVQ